MVEKNDIEIWRLNGDIFELKTCIFEVGSVQVRGLLTPHSRRRAKPSLGMSGEMKCSSLARGATVNGSKREPAAAAREAEEEAEGSAEASCVRDKEMLVCVWVGD